MSISCIHPQLSIKNNFSVEHQSTVLLSFPGMEHCGGCDDSQGNAFAGFGRNKLCHMPCMKLLISLNSICWPTQNERKDVLKNTR